MSRETIGSPGEEYANWKAPETGKWTTSPEKSVAGIVSANPEVTADSVGDTISTGSPAESWAKHYETNAAAAEQQKSPEQQTRDIAQKYIEAIQNLPANERAITEVKQVGSLAYAYNALEMWAETPFTSDNLGNLSGDAAKKLSTGIGGEYDNKTLTSQDLADTFRRCADDLGEAVASTKVKSIVGGLPGKVGESIAKMMLAEGNDSFSEVMHKLADEFEKATPENQGESAIDLVLRARKNGLESIRLSVEFDSVRLKAIQKFIEAIYPNLPAVAQGLEDVLNADQYEGFEGNPYSRDPGDRERAAEASRINAQKLAARYQDVLTAYGDPLDQNADFRQVCKMIEQALKNRFLESIN